MECFLNAALPDRHNQEGGGDQEKRRVGTVFSTACPGRKVELGGENC